MSDRVYQKDSFFSPLASIVCTVNINHGDPFQMKFWTKFQKRHFYPNSSQGNISSTNKTADSSTPENQATCLFTCFDCKQKCGSQIIVKFYDFIIFILCTDFYCLLYYCNFIYYFKSPKDCCNIKSCKFAVNKVKTMFNFCV